RAVRIAGACGYAVDQDLAPRRVSEAKEELDERRLAGAVGADEADHSSARDGDVDAAQHRRRAELLLNSREFDHRRDTAMESGKEMGFIAGAESTSASGVRDGSTRSAASSSVANVLRNRMRDAGRRSTTTEKRRTGRCGTSPVPLRSTS